MHGKKIFTFWHIIHPSASLSYTFACIIPKDSFAFFFNAKNTLHPLRLHTFYSSFSRVSMQYRFLRDSCVYIFYEQYTPHIFALGARCNIHYSPEETENKNYKTHHHCVYERKSKAFSVCYNMFYFMVLYIPLCMK